MSISTSVIQSIENSLRQLSDRTLTSEQFVAVAEQLYWSLLEGQYRSDRTLTANQLREMLSDITAQWEMLLGYLHNQQPNSFPEFPPEWVQQWLEQIQSIEQTPMPETPLNHP